MQNQTHSIEINLPPNPDLIPAEMHQPEQGRYFVPGNAVRLIEERHPDIDAPAAKAGPHRLAEYVAPLLKPPCTTPPCRPTQTTSARNAQPRRSSWVSRIAHLLGAQHARPQSQERSSPRIAE